MSASATSAYDDRDYPEMLARYLGPGVMTLLADEDVMEIGADPFVDHLWVDSRASGGKKQTPVTLSKGHIDMFLKHAAHHHAMLLRAETPSIECALPERIFGGARLTGHIPRIVPRPGFRIRKLPAEAYPLEKYLEWETFSPSQYEYLLEAIAGHLNIAVVGGTGTGKTTLVMSLLRKAGEMDPSESIVTIEELPELRVTHSHSWYPFYTTPHFDYTALLSSSLRSSPDRIVVGESRGESLVQLLDAFLTGHDGGFFTFHASSVAKALQRMYVNCCRASNTPTHRHTIGDAIDLIIVIDRRGEVRRAKQLVRVHGYTEDGGYELEPLS